MWYHSTLLIISKYSVYGVLLAKTKINSPIDIYLVIRTVVGEKNVRYFLLLRESVKTSSESRKEEYTRSGFPRRPINHFLLLPLPVRFSILLLSFVIWSYHYEPAIVAPYGRRQS
jgi:hypothetical protein